MYFLCCGATKFLKSSELSGNFPTLFKFLVAPVSVYFSKTPRVFINNCSLQDIMDIAYTDKEIRFEKEPHTLDDLVIEFTTALNTLHIKYVIISGYVAILFGRNRVSEDIDLFMEDMDLPTFKKLWNLLIPHFDCLNTHNSEEAYHEYLKNNNAIRFAKSKAYIPNIEIKFPKIDLDRLSLEHRKKVILNAHIFYISPLELQIIFKLSLGSEKDLEDARYLYNLFKEKLDRNALEQLFRKLNIAKELRRYIT